MSKWSKSLPEPINVEPWKSNRVAGALNLIAAGMANVDTSPDIALSLILDAAAEVRAFRKSLGVKVSDRTAGVRDIKSHLREACYRLLSIAGANGIYSQAIHLRYAEAHLREVAQLLKKEIDNE